MRFPEVVMFALVSSQSFAELHHRSLHRQQWQLISVVVITIVEVSIPSQSASSAMAKGCIRITTIVPCQDSITILVNDV